MGAESSQKKLDRVRPPRVQITYEVETEGAMEVKELPFVMGVMGDYSGKRKEPLPALKDRKFVEIDRDNFNKVLQGMAPRVAFRVDDKLSGEEDKQLNVELNFKSMDDFDPEQVARQIEPLRQLLETREKLKDLMYKLEGNDKLDEMLQTILNNTDARQALAKELGISDAGANA